MNKYFFACILAIIGCVCVQGAPNVGDLGSDADALPLFNGTTTEELVEYVKRRNLLMAEGRAVRENPAWRARLNPRFGKSYFAPALTANTCKGGARKCKSNLGSYPYDSYEKDPTGNSDEPVMRIGFPKGAWSPGGAKSGGVLFFAYPYKENTITKDNPFSSQGATIEYDVFVPSDFPFVKGGKMPGLAGGRSNGRGCGGGNDPTDCFSVRIMWRREGNGEVYIYAPEGKQGKNFCSKYKSCNGVDFPCTVCNYNKGVSFGRGTFKFKRGQWQRLTLSMVLNDVGKANGYLELQVDGKRVLSYDQMRWRTRSKVKVEAIDVASWFGGSDASWSPPKDTHILIKNMKAYRTGPATYSKLLDGRATVLSQEDLPPTEAVTSYEEIAEPIEYDDEY